MKVLVAALAVLATFACGSAAGTAVVGQPLSVNQLKFTALFLTSPPLAFANVLLKAINEVGLFVLDDDQPVPATNPSMMARNTFPSIPFDPVDREGVLITWTLTIV